MKAPNLDLKHIGARITVTGDDGIATGTLVAYTINVEPAMEDMAGNPIAHSCEVTITFRGGTVFNGDHETEVTLEEE